jgi:3-deoxy-manno-octulosonate cytidylyltransferase (CMP-KDO synthetase)
MHTLIVVPARYASSRLPGKPLIEIAGQSMVSRAAAMARRAAETLSGAAHIVATDHDEILSHCAALGIPAVMTDAALPSGTDRALAAAGALGASPEVVVNLQGDSPFTPPAHVAAVARAAAEPGVDVATPYVRLTWEALDQLRAHKKSTPFSGTTLTTTPDGRALWFSKNIIPAMRKEADLRRSDALSPVCRHIGLYAYRLDALRRYVALPESPYEKLEGLEQLRCLENGMYMRAVEVEPDRIAIPGIDTAEDVALAERLIAAFGDPLKDTAP